MLELCQQLAMGSRGLVCTRAAGGGTTLSLGHTGGAALSTRGPKQDALRHKVLADQAGLLWGSALPVSVPAPGSGFRSTAWGPQLAKRCAPFRNICQHCYPGAAADFPVTFGDDSTVTQMYFFTVKSYSKQNSQAPVETFLRREFSHLSIDWYFAKRHVLKPRTPGNSSPNIAEIQKKM